MTPAKRTRLYFGLLAVVAGVGASLLGLRAQRFVETRHTAISEAHALRRADLEQLAAADEAGRKLLAEHDQVVFPRTLERYEFGRRVAKSMQYGGLVIGIGGVLLIVGYLRQRWERLRTITKARNRGS